MQTIGQNPLDAAVEPDQPGAAPRAEEARSTSTAAAGAEQYLTFYLDGEEYAVGILRILEIVEYETLTRVPTTPPWIRGVMNLRGRVVPVVDLALKFGLPETAVTQRTCVVIAEADLEGEPTVMGVMVDEVSRVLDLAAQAVEEAPPFGTRARVDFLLGLGKVDGKFVMMLDIDRVLSTDELMTVAGTPEASSVAEVPTSEDTDSMKRNNEPHDSDVSRAHQNSEHQETEVAA